MSEDNPILVTGAAGSIGSVGRSIVKLLREKQIPVRALVHRLDERSHALADMGADVVVADLTNGADVVRALDGCRRMYFGMSVSPPYLHATAIAAAAAKQTANFEIFVNISQMTVSQMSLENMTESPQQQQHWLGEQILNWSDLPVVHLRSTVFMEHFFFSQLAARSIAKSGTIELPLGLAKTSPIAAFDVARVAATILENPAPHRGKIYELTGPSSASINEIVKEYEAALNRPVRYVDKPFEKWRDEDLRSLNLPDHVYHHIETMAKLHAANRYERLTDDVAKITGRPSMSIREYVESRRDLFASACLV